MPSFVVYGQSGEPDRVSFQQVGLAEYTFSKSREKCPTCKLKIRGKNHELHCKGR